MPLGRSDTLRVGDVVLAIGNPLGLSQTVTQGIVSATGRGQLGVADFENFIQTDAAINFGNSGGALVNAAGELVGINTAVLARTAGIEGIGFAIPVDLVRGVMQEILRNGRVIRGWLGVVTEDLSPQLAQALGVSDGGVLVRICTRIAPPMRAGLRRCDVITQMDGEPMQSSSAGPRARRRAGAGRNGAGWRPAPRPGVRVLDFGLRASAIARRGKMGSDPNYLSALCSADHSTTWGLTPSFLSPERA